MRVLGRRESGRVVGTRGGSRSPRTHHRSIVGEGARAKDQHPRRYACSILSFRCRPSSVLKPLINHHLTHIFKHLDFALGDRSRSRLRSQEAVSAATCLFARARARKHQASKSSNDLQSLAHCAQALVRSVRRPKIVMWILLLTSLQHFCSSPTISSCLHSYRRCIFSLDPDGLGLHLPLLEQTEKWLLKHQ